jgi:hypothetical protein
MSFKGRVEDKSAEPLPRSLVCSENHYFRNPSLKLSHKTTVL